MNYYLQRIFVLIALISFTIPCGAQVGKIIDQRFLLKEYDAITEHLIVTHPALYRFISIDSLTSLIQTNREKLDRPMDQLSFYKLVSPLFTAIGDGHTKLLMDESLFEKVLSRKGVFPYKVWIDKDNRMFVIDSERQDNSIVIGSEITHINKVSVSDFLKEAGRFVGFEHTAYRNSVISDNLNWLIALTQNGEDKFIEIEINSSAERHEVALIPFKKWKRVNKKKQKQKFKKVLEYENNEYRNLGNQVGYLKIYEFGSYDISKYIENVQSIFKKIREESISSLIIDLRDNSGGDARYVEALIHSISDIPFCRTEMMYQLKKGRPNSYYRLIGNRSEGIVRFAANHMVFSGNEDAFREPITFDNEFNGNIYVLINEKSYSAAATLASVIKCYDLGVVVGSMTGGTRIFQAYGATKSFQRSKFTSLVSSTMIFTSCSGFEDRDGFREGIIPDVVVNPTLNDVLDKRDVQLAHVLDMIEKGGYTTVYR